MFILYKLYYDDYTYYIGVTNNLRRRLSEHSRSDNTKNFINVEVLMRSGDEDVLYELEEQLIPDHINRDYRCRNKTRGGRHPYNMRAGVKHTLETRQKISKTKKGVPNNLTDRARIFLSEKMIGEKNPAKRTDVREKLSIHATEHSNTRGKPGTMTGKKHTENALKKISYEIKTPRGVFKSSVAAADSYGISQQTVINRCKSSKYPDWVILNKGSKYSKG
jgi:predicted GIY-YIG superfamily endonuclease